MPNGPDPKLSFQPQKIRWALIAAMGLVFMLCLWLFFDIWSSRKELQLLFRNQAVSESLLKDLLGLYRQEMALNTILGFLILVMGVLAFTYLSLALRTVGALRKSRNIDQYILESITRGVLTVTSSGRLTSCNRAFSKIMNISKEQCQGRTVREIFPADSPILAMVEKALRSNKQMDAEDEIVHQSPDHVKQPLRITTCALRDDSGASLGVILLIKDLTPIKALEERLRRQERLVAIGHLTRRILHEVRNPLAAMDLNLQLLEERLEDRKQDDRIAHYLRVIFSELHRLDSVLNNTHLSVTPPQVERRPLDLNALLHSVLTILDAQITHAGHVYQEQYVSGPVIIEGDADLLKEAFINLIQNALESLPAAAGKVKVGTRLQESRSEVLVEIQDSGRGIAWDHLSRVFDPYFTTKKKGTGLGLSIVHNIISKHQGLIQIASWVGEGTLVTIQFPLAEPGAWVVS